MRSATARVIRAFGPILESGTGCGETMRDWPGLPLEDALPLRLAGGLHNLHLTGDDDRLLPVYAGEVEEQSEIDAIVFSVVRDHDGRLLEWFERAPQTNEAGRSAVIMAGLSWIAGQVSPRFEALEIRRKCGDQHDDGPLCVRFWRSPVGSGQLADAHCPGVARRSRACNTVRICQYSRLRPRADRPLPIPIRRCGLRATPGLNCLSGSNGSIQP